MLRFQQYIELVRTQSQPRLLEAITHAKKYLVSYKATYPDELRKAFGLLAYPPHAAAMNPSYAELYSADRWNMLASLFTKTHNQLLSLPSFPLLHIALSSGLSALKTPACHSSAATSASSIVADHLYSGNEALDSAGLHAAHQNPSSDHTSIEVSTHLHDHHLARPAVASPASGCPICSTELNDLARNVPYAHHTKSHVDTDLLLLPNGNVFGRDRLETYAIQSGLQPGESVRDLKTGKVFQADQLKKVYIT